MFPDERLAGWLRTWAGEEEARMAGRLSLHDVPAMLHVAQKIVDGVVRGFLPQPQRYGRYPDGHPELAALSPIVDEASRNAALAGLEAQRERGRDSLALRSAEAALRVLDRLGSASSLEEASEAWATLFAPMGYLEMAILRTKRAGVDPEVLRAALASAMRDLTD